RPRKKSERTVARNLRRELTDSSGIAQRRHEPGGATEAIHQAAAHSAHDTGEFVTVALAGEMACPLEHRALDHCGWDSRARRKQTRRASEHQPGTIGRC